MISDKLFFAKFRSHGVKNEKIMTKKFVTAKCCSINYGATLTEREGEFKPLLGTMQRC